MSFESKNLSSYLSKMTGDVLKYQPHPDVDLYIHELFNKSVSYGSVCLLWECHLEYALEKQSMTSKQICDFLEHNLHHLFSPKSFCKLNSITTALEHMEKRTNIEKLYDDKKLTGNLIAKSLEIGDFDLFYKLMGPLMFYRDSAIWENSDRPHCHMYRHILDSDRLNNVQKYQIAECLLKNKIQTNNYFYDVSFNKNILGKDWTKWMNMGLVEGGIQSKDDTFIDSMINKSVNEFLMWPDPTMQLQWFKENTSYMPMLAFCHQDGQRRAELIEHVVRIWNYTLQSKDLENAIQNGDLICSKLLHIVFGIRLNSVECISTIIKCEPGYTIRKMRHPSEHEDAGLLICQWFFSTYPNLIQQRWQQDCPEIVLESSYNYNNSSKMLFQWLKKEFKWFDDIAQNQINKLV